MLPRLVSEGHILLEDTPGLGKTLLAKTLAQSIQDIFSRIQRTPDCCQSATLGQIGTRENCRYEEPALSSLTDRL